MPWNWPFLLIIRSYALKLAIFIVHEKPRAETDHFHCSLEATPWNGQVLLYIRSFVMKLAIFIAH